MKRTDLTPGMDVYYSDRANWRTNASGSFHARVVETRPWNPSTRGFGHRADDRQTEDGATVRVHGYPAYAHERGTSVLIETNPDRGPDEAARHDVVPLGHLRGLWEATRAQVAGNAEREAAERRARHEAQERVEREASAALEALRDRMSALGVPDATRVLPATSDGSVLRVSLTALTALVEAAERGATTEDRS